jgi:sarcosine oxidase subunit alpha
MPSKTLTFTFDGRPLHGVEGDTLASALLANGVGLVGRSFKYHRPRGILTAGPEEPNALLEIGEGNLREPNTRATEVRLYDGLRARSQNAWPSLRRDVLSINDIASPLLPAGFYYKTFLSPAGAWPLYERFIRRAAGLGRPTEDADPSDADERWAHCDVLVVGGGPAGLAAARAAVRSGLRTILCEQDFLPGGTLLAGAPPIEGMEARAWIAHVTRELDAAGARTLLRAVAFGVYDHNLVAISQRFVEPGQSAADGGPAHRLWFVRARNIIVASGAIERPLLFANNDRPGIMMSSAARAYVLRHNIVPGRRIVVATNNDKAWHDAFAIHDRGAPVSAIVDSREEIVSQLLEGARSRDIAIHANSAVTDTKGRFALASLAIGNLRDGTFTRLAADLLCMSGGYSPTVHLYAHARGKVAWNTASSMFTPADSGLPIVCVGAARGVLTLGESLRDGHDAACRAAAAAGKLPPPAPAYDVSDERFEQNGAAPRPTTVGSKIFVDFQNDVTAKDISIAAGEGYVSAEHLKRYTTLGMGTDQGKTSGVNGLAVLAGLSGQSISGAALTTFRPPYLPVSLTALARGMIASKLEPVRRTPLSKLLEAEGAEFVNSGLWRRARYFRSSGSNLHAAAIHEAKLVRGSVGITEVSTLAKFEIGGQDAAVFLDRVYATPVSSLKIGRARYGLMLRDDGFVFDDGTIWRLEADRYLVTGTTANTGAVLRHLEFCRDVVFPDLSVNIVDVTEQWAGVAIAGPQSRQALQMIFPDCELSDAALPYLGLFETTFADRGCRIARISFSGERCYEVYVPSRLGAQLWSQLRAQGIMPYGLEALELLRIEKGYPGVGQEINGRTTPADLGITLGSKAKAAFIGCAGLRRDAFAEAGRLQLVGLTSEDGREISEGAVLREPRATGASEGHVTSAGFGVGVGGPVALALLKDGARRHGEILDAADLLRKRHVPVRVANPTLFDPAGARLRG